MISFRYQNKDTIIHRLNPFCKLVWIISILVFVLIFDSPLYVALLLLATLPPIFMAKVAREWLALMKLSLYLCVAIIIINALVSNDGSRVLIEAPFEIPVYDTPVITLEAIFFGLIMCLRLLAVVSAFSILTLTIHPDDLMLVMTKLRLPYKSVLVSSLSTRFIPTLVDDAERITDVQRSRGLEFEKGGLVRKAKNRMAIVIPLLANSLDRAMQVAEAMESRAFGSGKARTFYKDIKISRTDAVALVFLLLTVAFGVFLRVSGHGDYDYYPTVSGFGISGIEWLLLAVLWLLLLMLVPLALVKRKVDLD